MYRVLQVEFQPDKVAKQKAEQIDLPKNAVTDFKKRRDEQDLSFNKKEPVKAKEEVTSRRSWKKLQKKNLLLNSPGSST